MDKYSVRLVYTYTLNDDKNFYEDVILTVNAESFDDAYEKAEKYAKDGCCEYTNIFGEKVSKTYFKLLDCFLAFDEDNGVQEVYSRFVENKTGLSESDFQKVITDQLTKDELKVLREA